MQRPGFRKDRSSAPRHNGSGIGERFVRVRRQSSICWQMASMRPSGRRVLLRPMRGSCRGGLTRSRNPRAAVSSCTLAGGHRVSVSRGSVQASGVAGRVASPRKGATRSGRRGRSRKTA